MGAQTAQVQSPQSSQPASKGAGQSASSEPGSGKGGQMSAMSGQPKMGQPNTNGNTALAPVNANFVAPNDGVTNSNPYPNTIGNMGSAAGNSNVQPLAKGGGGNQGGGKGSTATGSRLVDFPQLAAPFDPNMAGKTNNDPLGLIENTYHPNRGPQGPGANY